MRLPLSLRVLAAAAVLLIAACSPSSADRPVRVGMVPDAGATQVAVGDKAPLKDYLQKALGHSVALVIPTSYNATVEGIGNGSLDIAYLGGLTYVKAHQLYGAVPLVQRDIDQNFRSLFITGTNTGIDAIDDLRGKSFCFGDINSTSGHLIPEKILRAAGIDPAKELGSTRFTGSHPATAQAVAAGTCDAGAIDETVFKSLVDGGKIDPRQVRTFYTSGPFADYVWVARKGLPPAEQQAFAKALLALKPGSDDAVLKVLRATHYVRASNTSYAGVAATAKTLGLL
ncbi:MAG: phosphate/phosphite/phosphonate ABC transporter substrate-binding protein [Sphingomonas sp.]